MIMDKHNADNLNASNETKRHSQPPRGPSIAPPANTQQNQSDSSDDNQVNSIIHSLDDIEQQRSALMEQLRSTRTSLSQKIAEIDQKLNTMEGSSNTNNARNRGGRTSSNSRSNTGNKGSNNRRSMKRVAQDGATASNQSSDEASGGQTGQKRRGRPVGSKNGSRSMRRNSTEGQTDESGTMRQRSAREGGLVSFLREVFQKTNKPMTVNELRDALQETEWKSTAKQPYQIIYTALTSHGDVFKKVEGERGTFKLI
jgi:hypothetical protein